MSAILDAALGYAARGWPVFPCKPGAKIPATPHGVLDATTDPARIRAWWEAMPAANVAIATGEPGPDVIDVDVKPDGAGYSAFAELTRATLLGAASRYVRTPSGGLHAYHAGSTQRNGSIRGHHIDFRAAGGYVLAPPSIVSDRPYDILSERGQADAVDWRAIRACLEPPPDPEPFRQPSREHPGTSDLRPGDDWAARTSWAQILAPRGWRRVRELGNGRACWCRPGKAGPLTSATTREDGGLYVFSTSTEFEPEVPYSKFGAWALLEHGGDHRAAAAQLRRDGFGAQEPAITFAQPAQAGDGQQDDSDDWWSEIAARHVPIDWQRLFDDTPEEEDWIIAPLLAAGRSIALYSLPKAGKSLLALEIMAALVTGRPVLGQPPGRIRKVLYVDLENSRRDIRDRLASLGYKAQDLAGLIYLSFPSLPALDSAQGGREIVGLAMAHQADVVVIDTVSRVISGKENDADTFAALYRYAMAPLKGLGIAVARLDHAGKDAGKGQRGSSAKNADVDAVWTLTVAGPVITLDCEMTRTPIGTQSVSLRRETGPLRHEVTSQATGSISKVQALMAKLDELGIPRDAANKPCQEALNRAHVPLNTNDLRAAVRTRKLQPILSDDLETGDLEVTPESPCLKIIRQDDAGTGKHAGQSLTQDHQTGETEPDLGDSAESVSSGRPPRRGDSAQTDSGAGPVCTRCGERYITAHDCPRGSP